MPNDKKRQARKQAKSFELRNRAQHNRDKPRRVNDPDIGSPNNPGPGNEFTVAPGKTKYDIPPRQGHPHIIIDDPHNPDHPEPDPQKVKDWYTQTLPHGAQVTKEGMDWHTKTFPMQPVNNLDIALLNEHKRRWDDIVRQNSNTPSAARVAHQALDMVIADLQKLRHEVGTALAAKAVAHQVMHDMLVMVNTIDDALHHRQWDAPLMASMGDKLAAMSIAIRPERTPTDFEARHRLRNAVADALNIMQRRLAVGDDETINNVADMLQQAYKDAEGVDPPTD